MGNVMEIKDIYAFMDKAEKTAYDEISLEIDNVKLTLKKNVSAEGRMPSGSAAPITASETPTAEDTADYEDSNLVAVKSPFVGTFYRAASPEDKPFVMVGQKVSKGDVVGIIEAMKLMNEITAPQDGIVESIEAEDGEMVEYNKNIVMLKIS
jgi:acetyl-CoA carboxylase biotin carboxyl carrier protein